jgi:CubicO group peptidase (beta-lactamase class C family)
MAVKGQVTDWSEVDRLLDGAAGSVFPSARLIVIDALTKVKQRSAGGAKAETEFDIASLTKPLATVNLTMMALERGRIALADEPRPGVTVQQLLAHASGLPAWQLLAPAPGFADARAGIVEAVRSEPLESAPGAVSRYSDLGFILLGDWLEQRLGARLDALFTEWIADPLGLAIGYGPRAPAPCAPTEGELRGVVHDENARAMGGVAGHAGLFATADDVAALAAVLLATWAGKSEIGFTFSDKSETHFTFPVSPSTLRKFWSPSGVPGSTWCLGWDRPSASGSSAGARWPRDGVRHLGFTGCSLWLDPPRGRAVVLLSNRVHPSRANDRIKPFRPLLHDAVSAALDGA